MEAHVVIFYQASVGSHQQQANTALNSSDKSLNGHKCANLGGQARSSSEPTPTPESNPKGPPPGAASADTQCFHSFKRRSYSAQAKYTCTSQQQSAAKQQQAAAKLNLPDFHAKATQLPYFLLSGLLLALMHLSLTGEPSGCLAQRPKQPAQGSSPHSSTESLSWPWRSRVNSAGGRQSEEGEARGGGSEARLSLIHRRLAQVRHELELELELMARTRQVALDSPCLNSGHCSQAIPSSHCNLTSFTCTCLPHHVRLNSSMCLAPSLLGYKCLSDAQCQYKVANSYCSRQGLCECQSNFVTYRKDKCLPESKIDDYCLSDRQCQLADPHSHCKWRISFVYGRCKCPPNYMTATKLLHTQQPGPTSGPHDRPRRHYCLPRLGDACLDATECLLATPNSLCRHPLAAENLHLSWRTSNVSQRRCFCQEGFVESQDRMRCELAPTTTTTSTTVAPVFSHQLSDAVVMNQKHQYELLQTENPQGISNSEEGSQEFEVTRAGDEYKQPQSTFSIPPPISSPATTTITTSTLTSSGSSFTNSSLNSTDASSSPEISTTTTTNSPVPITESVPPPTPAPTPVSNSTPSPPPPTPSQQQQQQQQQQQAADLNNDQHWAAPAPVDNKRKISSLGKACQDNQECQARDPHSHCLLGRCECIAPSAQCSANSTGCHRDTFQCRTTGQCISWYFVCDQFKNCADGSDEDECQVAGRCPPQAFQCVQDGTCLTRSKVCDGKRDCPDGSDEQLCVKPPVAATTTTVGAQPPTNSSHHCHPKAFTCNSGECVPGHALCNAIDDCRDASDENELLCQRSIILNRKWPLNQLMMRGGRPSAEVRLFAETRVSAVRAARRRNSRLLNGGLQFLPETGVGSSGQQSECPKDSFTCRNGKCRSTAILCSGRDGCGDNSDENRCQVCQCSPPTPEGFH